MLTKSGCVTSAQTLASTSVRDSDLLQRIADSSKFMREVITRQCEEEQDRRDAIASLPAGERRRARTRAAIAEEGGADRDNLRHIHSVLAICSLPYTRQASDVREWSSKQGKMSLLVTAGKLMSPESGEWVDQPLPYGSRARLLMLHTCSEAIRQNSPVVEIEDSLTGFIRSMGFAVTGGKNGTLTSFKQQINALAACKMQIGLWDGSRSKTVNTQPFSAIDVWFPTAPQQKMLWPSTVTFSQDFFNTLTKHALPINARAVRAFAGSPRKLDMLFWLGYRLHALNEPLKISWEALQEQWGINYSRASNFKRDFVKEINEIKEVFPKLPVKIHEKGCTISPGATEVLAIPAKIRKT